MPTTRRRIVRRAVMALVVIVLVPVMYVASTLTVTFAAGAGWSHSALVTL